MDTVCTEHDMNARIIDSEVKASGEIVHNAFCQGGGGHEIEVIEF
jgi:hypothetical protein